MSWLQESRERRAREYEDHMAPAYDWGYHLCTWMVLTLILGTIALYTIGMYHMLKPYDEAIVDALVIALFVNSQVTWLTGRLAKGTDTHWMYVKRALKYQLVSFVLVFSVAFVVSYFFIR